jgi:lipopolysaccharide transport system permease protein
MIILNYLKKYIFATKIGLLEPLQAVYQHRYLLILLIKRDITTRTTGTILGHFWLIFQPALQILGFWFLLDIVLKIKLPNGVAFVDYFLIGMLPWLFISEILSRSLNILSEFGGLYKKSVFPIEILPILPLILAAALYILVMILTVSLIVNFTTIPIAIISILLIAIWLIPFAYLLSIIGLFLKDIGQFFPFLITITLYLTPILYMPTQMPEAMQWALIINPIADIMALIHAGIQGLPWTWGNVLRPLILWILLIGPAWVLFKRAQLHIREVV